MIDPARLLADLQRLLKRLEDDIRGRVQDNGAIDARLREQYEKAKAANRTAQAYEVWRDDYITQVAVAWILGCVFIRFLEDNGLIAEAWLSGPGERLQLARDQHTLYFQGHPSHSDREYLEHVFSTLAKLPSMRDLLDGKHNPLTKLGPSGDGAHELREFWQKIDPATGVLIHDFTDPNWNTRFLGDLYQDLSAAARDRYALLQTPEFVEEFILDRTLNPAVEEFGYATVKMIDPACGSGHFLLGGFKRLLALRIKHEPGVPTRAHAQAALNQVFGLDINPFAVAIAKFRLLIAAILASAGKRLSEAPDFEIHLAVGDSLLHGPSPRGLVGVQRSFEADPLQHYYDIEDPDIVADFLRQQYHVVVGNPPYITVKDQALNSAYRTRFQSCHGKYSLAVPFKERMFDLAVRGDHTTSSAAGFVGMITANSFMKREFGKKLIEEYLPRIDLTHVIDTSLAYVPGHTTSTVILFGRARPPLREAVRMVLGIRGEPGVPIDPSEGLVWRSICASVDTIGYQDDYISVTDSPRSTLCSHPWSIGGGGAAELKHQLDQLAGAHPLREFVVATGPMAITGLEEVFVGPKHLWEALGTPSLPYYGGDAIRDWIVESEDFIAGVYDSDLELRPCSNLGRLEQFLWPYRTNLRKRLWFGVYAEDKGIQCHEYMYIEPVRATGRPSFIYPCVATHNAVVEKPYGSVTNQHASVIVLKPNLSATEVLALYGILNSSLACFWLKQVMSCKGLGGQGGGIKPEDWHRAYEFDNTKLLDFPVPVLSDAVAETTRQLHECSNQLAKLRPPNLFAEGAVGIAQRIQNGRREAEGLRLKMVGLQEELDWLVYRAYGLTAETSTVEPDQCRLHPESRPVEIRLREQMASGQPSIYYSVHQYRGVPEGLVECNPDVHSKRRRESEQNPLIRLIETPNYKRRWQVEPWEHQAKRALQGFLLDRLGQIGRSEAPALRSCAQLADDAERDSEFLEAAQAYRGQKDVAIQSLVSELVSSAAVPFLPILRFKPEGLAKRSIWARTWALQRQEDEICRLVGMDPTVPESMKDDVTRSRVAEAVGEIPVPPKFESRDFQKSSFWALRGKLDVPKERFLSFPHCERDVDPTAVIAWAGWDHLQLAQAIAAYYERVKNQEGWTPERRMPLLACILELLPWLKQWHNDIHPEFQERMGDFFEQFVQDEARSMEMTVDQIRAWSPPVQTSRGRRRRNS